MNDKWKFEMQGTVGILTLDGQPNLVYNKQEGSALLHQVDLGAIAASGEMEAFMATSQAFLNSDLPMTA